MCTEENNDKIEKTSPTPVTVSLIAEKLLRL